MTQGIAIIDRWFIQAKHQSEPRPIMWNLNRQTQLGYDRFHAAIQRFAQFFQMWIEIRTDHFSAKAQPSHHTCEGRIERAAMLHIPDGLKAVH